MDRHPGDLPNHSEAILRRIRRAIAASLLFVFAALILALVMKDRAVESRDFMEYWAAGHQLVQHENPYDPAAILRLFRSAGYPAGRDMVQIVRNPPSALFITLPLGLLSMRAAAILWSLAIVAALMSSVRMLWLMAGKRDDRLHLIGYCFAPVLACLLAGQVGIFLLFGATLFLYFHTSRPYAAGAGLLLCLLKPHLFLPFAFAFVAWVVTNRAYRILIGTGAAWIASTALTMILDPSIWRHYVEGEKGENIQNLFIACLSCVFRLLIHRDAVWLQFLPAIGGSIWALWYFRSRRDRWTWVERGPLLLLVSVLVAPYAWFTDEALALPAVLFAICRVADRGRSFLPFGFFTGIALFEVVMGLPLTSPFYLWTAPAWLACYVYSLRGSPATLAAIGAPVQQPSS